MNMINDFFSENVFTYYENNILAIEASIRCPMNMNDFYFSITIPALIVATHGGGTGLATQRECLELMDCYGKGKAKKLAEIVAATALAGELSLMGAMRVNRDGTSDWITSHDKLGRNR